MRRLPPALCTTISSESPACLPARRQPHPTRITIPAAFLSSIPAGLVRGFDWGALALYAAGTLLIVLAARGIFYGGLRRYESGNLVVARL